MDRHLIDCDRNTYVVTRKGWKVTDVHGTYHKLESYVPLSEMVKTHGAVADSTLDFAAPHHTQVVMLGDNRHYFVNEYGMVTGQVLFLDSSSRKSAIKTLSKFKPPVLERIKWAAKDALRH